MTEKENHNNSFTAQDIERYYSGKMSPQEMHLLEKAALDDPFLADALEGYQYTKQPSEDSKQLKAALDSRIGERKVVALSQSGLNKFWKIAALFILIVGAGWLVYQLSFTESTDNIAITTDRPAEKASETNSADLDTEIPETTQDSIKNAQATDVVAEETVPAVAETKKRTEIAKKENEIVEKHNNAEALTLSTDNYNPAMNRSYRAANDTGKNAGIAAFSDGDTVTGAASDTSATGVAATPQQTIEPGRENVIVMQRSKNNPVPEVILSKNRTDSAFRKPSIVFEEAVPEKGEIYYNDYLAENLKLPKEVNLKTQPGVVRLSFDVNDIGEPVNITVEKSLCEACDKEAIRILKEGPKLVKKQKNKKGKVSIRF